MSFCSQALIGFCNAETGVSQDVGVALSMGQGEPVSIQPWTLPPTHPSLPQGATQGQLRGDSGAIQGRLRGDIVTYDPSDEHDDDAQFIGPAHPILGRDDVVELSSLSEISVVPLHRWYVIRGAASVLVRRPYLSYVLTFLRSLIAWIAAAFLSTALRVASWSLIFIFINMITTNLAFSRFACSPVLTGTNATHCSSSHTSYIDTVGNVSGYVSTATGISITMDKRLCLELSYGGIQTFKSNINIELSSHGSVSLTAIPTVDACMCVFFVMLLQLFSAWRASAAACFSSPLEHLRRAELHLRIHAKYEYFRGRFEQCCQVAIFSALWLLLVFRRIFSRLIVALPFLAITVGKLITCTIAPCIFAFLLTNQNVIVGATDVGFDFPSLPVPSAPPIIHGSYGAQDLFVYNAGSRSSNAMGRFHAKPSATTFATAPTPQVRLPPGLQHAQHELDAMLSDADQCGLHDTGCSFDCHVSRRAFPTINGVSSLLPPPANVSISGAEGDVKPPEGYGRAQTVMRANDGEDYIYNSTQAWFTPSFDRSLFSESSMGFHARANSKFYFGRRIDFPNATVPLKLKNRVYELSFKFLDQTTYGPVPHGAEVGGLWRARHSAPPLPPGSASSLPQPSACTVGATRGRSTTKPLQADWDTQHGRSHGSPRVLSKWHLVANGVGKCPESLANVCDACNFADGNTSACKHDSPEPAHEGAWCLDYCGPFPESLYGRYRYAAIASNRTNRQYFFCPTRTRDEMQDVRPRLVAHCTRKGLEFNELTVDGAGEMISHDAVNFLLGKGAALNIACPYEHNNRHAEHAIGRCFRMARQFMCCGLEDADCVKLWPEAIACAVQVHNVLPSKFGTVWSSPDLQAGLERPDVSHLRAPFCDARILLQGPNKQTKVLPKRVHAMYTGPCIFGQYMGWTFITSTNAEKAKSHEAIFCEKRFSGLRACRPGAKRAATGHDPSIPPLQSDSSDADGEDDDALPTRQRQQVSRFTPSAPPPKPPPKAPAVREPRTSPRRMVPASIWPDYTCIENDGAGWNVEVLRTSKGRSLIHFTDAKLSNGSRYGDMWISSSVLSEIAIAPTAPIDSSRSSPTPLNDPQPSVGVSPSPQTPQDDGRAGHLQPGQQPADFVTANQDKLGRPIRRTRVTKAVKAACIRIAAFAFCRPTSCLEQCDPLGICSDQTWSDAASLPNISTSLAAAEASVQLCERSFDSCINAFAAAVTSMPLDDPIGRKSMLKHSLCDSFLQGEDLEWNSFINDGHMEIKDVCDKPSDAHCGQMRWVYKTRHGDGVQPACGRSRMVYDKACYGAAAADTEHIFGGLPTYLPSVPWDTTCCLFALKVQYQMCCIGCDVRMAYLNAKLPAGKGYWARMPPERQADHPGKLLYFSSAIYGADPSGRAWFDKNMTGLEDDIGMRRLKCEPTMAVRNDKRGLLIVAINTDDGIILGSNQAVVDGFREYYGTKYSVRWGDITRFGGVNVNIDNEHNTITLDQADFIEKSWFKWRDLAGASRPGGARGEPLPSLPARDDLEMLTSPQALAANSPSPDLVSKYKSCLGDASWACNRTRKDCLATFSMLGKAMDKPNEELLQRCIELHAFMYATNDYRIVYSKSTYNDPVGFSDANLGAHRSQTGYAIYLANAPVVAISQAQKCVVLSSCEAELVALSACACAMLWLRILLGEIGIAVHGASPIFCDNQAAKKVAENPVSAKQLRHVERRHFFVQDTVDAGCITVPYVESNSNLADILTKILPNKPKYEWAAARLRSWSMKT